ncbi:hypothetical protein BT96DRAFT_1025824 [Gymnopus androsaceus JB14]|uniref:Uncharacterized protein n=1 Tax=Gymnopus androsaceus JB14 TaxID=1447944 RepID=A0A6A4GQ98_9AGAR|nr:hypothetical protein BT96DRAFT_1025824 [Gymnopus androsaceus JB14]
MSSSSLHSLTSLSTSPNVDNLQTVEEFYLSRIKTHRLFHEFHWGLQPRELDLDSHLNRVSVRSDIAGLLSVKALSLIPSEETLSSMWELAKHNQRCSIDERWRCFDVLPIQSYQYKLVPGSRNKCTEIPLFAFDPQTSSFEQFSYPYDDLPAFTLDLYPFHSVIHSSKAVWTNDRSSPLYTIFNISISWMGNKPASFGQIAAGQLDTDSDSDSWSSNANRDFLVACHAAGRKAFTGSNIRYIERSDDSGSSDSALQMDKKLVGT